ncbi:nucleotidyltransferase [Aminipila butyrica]|uniref:tRNA(Met) cytidine acetate ligase n=1 Tax=Aminipila butyrica TaxID=433296 RepID=A0A858BTW5_9FIRM|nr:nucleotidyltransferase [Aminipila butyrica]QIB69373.1 nucleotidyltransferase [Aminipila butyrica]
MNKNMNVLGIIAEYNPFHNGHLYQLRQSVQQTEADFVVVLISGNFTQRGEPALTSKWSRAEMAVNCGADLVLELPFAFACNSAEYFARGAVELFNRLGCITHLSFGSESGDLDMLQQTAAFLAQESEEFSAALKNGLHAGLSYPKARAEAATRCLGPHCAQLLADPNNILAVEYLKQLTLTKSDIIPITVKRLGSSYHEPTLTGPLASASAIRKQLAHRKIDFQQLKDTLPEPVLSILLRELTGCQQNSALHPENECFPRSSFQSDQLYLNLLRSRILTASDTDLNQIFSVSEGLEHKLKDSIRRADSLTQLQELLKSKRYTATRISRLLAHVLVGLTKTDMAAILEQNQGYGRILGFSQGGSQLLKLLKKSKKTALPLITNINKQKEQLQECQLLLSYDLLASDFYNLLTEKNLYYHSDQVHQPYKKPTLKQL